MTRTALFAAATLLLCACPKSGDDTGEGLACSTEAIASVNVTLVDSAGVPIAGASATFTGGSFVDEPCDSTDGHGLFACGWEVAGEITIKATAGGYLPAEQTFTVAADECHVIPQSATMTLAVAAE